jgi:hypothetical protein
MTFNLNSFLVFYHTLPDQGAGRPNGSRTFMEREKLERGHFTYEL